MEASVRASARARCGRCVQAHATRSVRAYTGRECALASAPACVEAYVRASTRARCGRRVRARAMRGARVCAQRECALAARLRQQARLLRLACVPACERVSLRVGWRSERQLTSGGAVALRRRDAGPMGPVRLPWRSEWQLTGVARRSGATFEPRRLPNARGRGRCRKRAVLHAGSTFEQHAAVAQPAQRTRARASARRAALRASSAGVQ